MQYAIFKWHFLTDVRFGAKGQLSESGYIMHSDSLFSALCLEALKLGGEKELDKLYQLCSKGQLLLSDTMPYIDEKYFLPKPIFPPQKRQAAQESNSVLKKAYKKLSYIEAAQFQNYLDSLKGAASFDAQSATNQLSDYIYDQDRVQVSVQGQGEPLPYYINSWHFAKPAGLYFIAGYEDEKTIYWLGDLLTSLGYTGIGGKKSSGLGKFELEDSPIYLDAPYCDSLNALQNLLQAENPQWYMTLSVALPKPNQLENALNDAFYQVLKRTGFIDSVNYAAEQRKHRNLYVLNAGSCFKQPFDGDIYDVSLGGNHPVYRYAQPLFMGVTV